MRLLTGAAHKNSRFARSRIDGFVLRFTSEADEIQLNLLVSVLACPQIEWRSSDFVHQRHGQTKSSEIDTLQVAMTALACVEAQVLECGRLEVPEPSFVLFAAVRTQDAPEGPLREAHCAQEQTTAAFGRGCAGRLENRHLRSPSATRTAVRRLRRCAIAWCDARVDQPLSVGL